MKFKGFWTELKILNDHSREFMKDYWLLYFIYAIIATIIGGLIGLISLGAWAKFEDWRAERIDQEYEEMMNK